MEYLTETSVGDLLKVIDAFGEVLKTTPEKGKSKLGTIIKNSGRGTNYKGSITSQANKLCMTFPVICSNTITPTTASMISKAIERKCTLMLHQIFAADILVAGEGTGGIEQKINSVYTGIDFDTLSVDDLIKITDRVEGKTASFFEATEIVNEVAELSKKKVNLGTYESSVNENSVSTYMLDKNGYAKVDPEMIIQEVTKAEKAKMNKDYINKLYDELQDTLHNGFGAAQSNNKDREASIDKAIKISKEIRDRTGFDFRVEDQINARNFNQANIDKILADIENNKKYLDMEIEKNQRERDREAREISRDARDKTEYAARMRAAGSADLAARNDQFKKALMDTDVKKVNELVPSLLIVNYAVTVKDGEPITSSAIVGVKTRVIALDSFQILDKLASKNKDKSGLVKFIKATTGEIKFIKDFVLAIDKAKVDALSRSKRGSANPIWRVLERRAALNNLRRALNQKNDASPITTLVVTQEEVDYLRKTAGMELDNVNTANYIINAFNLMGLCIVDETTEVAKFLFDGEFNQFDTYAFGTLEREASGDGGMYKKVINLMAKRM